MQLLSDELATYREDGYLFYSKPILSKDEIAAVLSQIGRVSRGEVAYPAFQIQLENGMYGEQNKPTEDNPIRKLQALSHYVPFFENLARDARIVDVVESMLKMFLEALQNDDRKALAKLKAMDDTVDQLHNAVKLHLTAISREDGLSEADAKRCSDILAFAINLEHIGDILDKSLREIAAKKMKQRLTFSREGLQEIANMHGRLLENLHLATSVFMLGDVKSARALLAEKDRMRELEHAATENHLRRLREGRPQSIETSSLHIDIARDLKRIAAHIASVAYPILEESGSLRRSRLIDE